MGARSRVRSRVRSRSRVDGYLDGLVRPLPFLVTNALFIYGMLGVGLWAAWPIYQGSTFFVTAGIALLAGSAIAWVGMARTLSAFTLVLVTLAAYLLLGVPAAMPSALTSLPAAGSGLLSLITATVLSWKELVTISIPVDSYQTLLVPLFILVLGATTLALSLAWRSERLHPLAIPAALTVQLFGVLAGPYRTSAPAYVGPVAIPAPREILIGLIALLLAVGFLTWRARDARQRALRLASRATGVRHLRSGWPSRARRGGLAAGTLILAITLAFPLATPLVAQAERDVLRTGIDPAVTLRDYVSPLSQYRTFQTGPLFDTTLFSVSEVDGDLDRLRLAVLSHYDGEVYRVVDPARGDTDRSTAFARVPNIRSVDGMQGAQISATITAADYDGVWLPLAGSLTRIDFLGSRRDALSDAFYYSGSTDAGVELRALGARDSYRFEAVLDDTVVPVAELPTPTAASASGTSFVDDALIPDSLVAWVTAQNVGTDGAGLAELITRLRERGYLSHALDTPAADAGWTQDLGEYAFAPSLAGHSVARIDDLFTAMLNKQASTPTAENSALVAAVGDDEQFAVAAALIAAHLGFPSRVVLGFALTPPDADSAAIPACAAGLCQGKNLSAWIEVQGADGRWSPVDATPQHENPLSPRDEQLRDPQIPTDVVQADAQEQAPPEASPTGGEERPTEDAPETVDLSWLISLVKIVGISLLAIAIILAPFLAIIGAKFQRRRERKRGGSSVAQIAGGWDEYVDTVVDTGSAAPGSQTRTEFAARHGSEQAATLATLADEAVFGPVPPTSVDSERFWALVDAERAALGRDTTRRARLRAALSLRSFSRALR